MAESIKNILDSYVLDAFSHVCRRDHKSYGSFCVQSRSTIPKVDLGHGKRQMRVVTYNDTLENSDNPEGSSSSSSNGLPSVSTSEPSLPTDRTVQAQNPRDRGRPSQKERRSLSHMRQPGICLGHKVMAP